MIVFQLTSRQSLTEGKMSISCSLPLKTFLELFLNKYLSSSYWMSPFVSRDIQPVHTKGNQPWMFIRRTDAEAEALILWPPDVKSRLIGKDPDAGKDWGQEEKGTTGDEMVRWHHRLNGHEFEQTLGDSEGQRRLACCSPWDHKELDKT